MKYWIDGIAEPLTRQQLQEQRDRFNPMTRCAPVGINEWRPLSEVLPDLFHADSAPLALPEASLPTVMSPPFSRESWWPLFFYMLAAVNGAAGLVAAIFFGRFIVLLSAISGCLVCLFFAFVTQLLMDIRWLLSQR